MNKSDFMGSPSERRRSLGANPIAGRTSTPSSNRLLLGLMSRLLPLVVLMLGGCWLMLTIQPASAQQNRAQQNRVQPNQGFTQPYQNPNTRFAPIGNQPGQRFNNNGAAGQPVFRTAAVPSTIPSIEGTAGDPSVAGADSAEDAGVGFFAGWEMPSLVLRIMEGGWLMLPLAFCSLVVMALSLERLFSLRRGRVIPRPFVRRFTECVEDGQLSYDEATAICEDFDCPVSEVFRAALRRWGRPMLEIEQAVMDAGDRVAERLRRFLRVFHAISNVAPLIGLLGTVIGMIQAFEVISTQDSIGRPELLAAGISTALLTTAGGLCVAIPAYLAYMYFSSKSDRLLGEIDKLCQRVVDSISAEGLENSGSRKKRRAA